MKKKLTAPGSLTLAAALLFFGGCATSRPPAKVAEAPRQAPEVQAADKLFQAGEYEKATAACIDIARKDPLTPGLSALEARIQEKMAALRKADFDRKANPSDANAIADGMRHGLLPTTYGLSHTVRGDNSSLRTPPTPMQSNLWCSRITVRVPNLGLSDILDQIHLSSGFNIIADNSIGSGGTLSINVENAPLSEVFDYIGRNLNVAFYVGENLIWVTKRAGTNENGVPFETRMYHLRKGLSGEEIQTDASNNAGDSKDRSRSKSSSGGTSDNAPVAATLTPSFIDAVKRFVPQPTGADILFNPKSHVLLVKNTHENLLLTDDIVAALDVRPVQVLIEARFMDLSVTDLRQLGVDWVLNSNLGINTHDGKTSQINQNGTITTIPLGTAADTAKNALYKDAGLNLTYQGVLTDPLFQATLHAMEQSGKARTLSVPRVTTINNQTAKMWIGDDFQYYKSWTIEQTTVNYRDRNGNDTQQFIDNLVPSGDPTVENLGYTLLVTPSVGADLGTIDLKLAPSIESVKDKKEWVTYDRLISLPTEDGDATIVTNTISLPNFKHSSIYTEATVHSGETVVLGGLATSTRSIITTGVPILSSLPWIGHLFRNDRTQDDVDNLIIFVTATIVADTGEELVPLDASERPGLPLPAGTR